MTATEAWAEVGHQLGLLGRQILFGLNSRLAPAHLLATLALVYALWLWRRPGASFWAWALPARIYRGRAFRIEVWLYLLNYMVAAACLGLSATLTTGTATAVQGALAALAGTAGADPRPAGLIAAAALIAASDLAIYLVHRMHHDIALLWPVHALHHAAEDLSPVSGFRHHPLFQMLAVTGTAVAVGVAQGLLLGLLFDPVSVASIAGVNVFLVLFNAATANLRHSHIWLSFGPVLEHVLISPAQHQIHHSAEPRHHNRNYGEILAIWDWMFGTLYVTRGPEPITFGLGDADGRPLPDPYQTLGTALFRPIADFVTQARRLASARGGSLPESQDRE